jgi:hypothetical protein
MSDIPLPARYLYRFTLPCYYRPKLGAPRGMVLDETHRLPGLAELEGRPVWAEVRAAWNEEGLALAVRVQGKRQPLWRPPDRPEESDGLHVWIDTRDVHNVHRAGRFCHRFAFLPGLKGDRSDLCKAPFGPLRGKSDLSPWECIAAALPIHRAKEPARPVPPGALKVRGEQQPHGYFLEAWIPSEALGGYDPAEHPRLGFTYAALDRELGEQTLTAGSPLPYQEDPSLWATLELVKEDLARSARNG